MALAQSRGGRQDVSRKTTTGRETREDSRRNETRRQQATCRDAASRPADLRRGAAGAKVSERRETEHERKQTVQPEQKPKPRPAPSQTSARTRARKPPAPDRPKEPASPQGREQAFPHSRATSDWNEGCPRRTRRVARGKRRRSCSHRVSEARGDRVLARDVVERRGGFRPPPPSPARVAPGRRIRWLLTSTAPPPRPGAVSCLLPVAFTGPPGRPRTKRLKRRSSAARRPRLGAELRRLVPLGRNPLRTKENEDKEQDGD